MQYSQAFILAGKSSHVAKNAQLIWLPLSVQLGGFGLSLSWQICDLFGHLFFVCYSSAGRVLAAGDSAILLTVIYVCSDLKPLFGLSLP